MVSDAGMPGISDPGSLLVQEAIAAGVPVIPIPGANAALSALIASGLPTSEFQFLGFLPEKTGARRTRLEDLAAEPRQGDSAQTLIFYEAPHRILDTLADLEFVWGPDLRVALARELTKLHEEFLARHRRRDPQGTRLPRPHSRRICSCSSKRLPNRNRAPRIWVPRVPRLWGIPRTANPSQAESSRLQAESGIDEKEALKRLARELGQSKSELYRELQRERARRK